MVGLEGAGGIDNESFDPETGGVIARSHRDRIRETLQDAEDDFVAQRSESLTATNYLAYVATGSSHREAMFYLSSIVDLTREASNAGVPHDDLEHFIALLLEDVAPTRLGAEALAAEMPLR